MAMTRFQRSNKPTTRLRRKNSHWLRCALIPVIILVVALGLQTSAYLQEKQNAQPPDSRTRQVPARAKQSLSRRENKPQKSSASGPSASDSLSPLQNIAAPLATADLALVGLSVTAAPGTQTVPKNTATIIQTSVQTPPDADPQPIIAQLNPNYRVRGELVGPSFNSPLTLEAQIGQPLRVPPLPNAGDHVVQNLRVVDTGVAGQPVVAAVTPESCGLKIIDQVLFSEVHVQEMTYDQIVNSGININDDSYQFFNFNIGLVTSSGIQNLNIPAAFPPVNSPTLQQPIVGVPDAPAGTPVPDIFPIMLEPEVVGGGGGGGSPIESNGGGVSGIRVPGVVVFPGRVGFLQQHFEAIVIVANGTPQGSGLVVKQLRAKITLPPAGAEGPPLAIAETQVGGQVTELELHGLGADGRYGTADDSNVFPSGASGQASFLLRGLRQGLHTVNFELQGRLEGLPLGPINVKGQISGAVLVRDASFAIGFTHPAVVRQGQEYDLTMTLYNQGGSNLLGALAQLGPGSISGASLLGNDNGQRAFPTTIGPNDSGTVTWRLRSNRTGAVTAGYVRIDNGASISLGLTTGVGDRNIPLSPDSLALPEAANNLPANVVEAARAVLGQAWSVATAPPGSLPAGVRPVSKKTVMDRAAELGVAGLRVKFGEPVHISLVTLLRDWLGELQTIPDQGFADVLRNTPTGYRFYDSIGAVFQQQLLTGLPTLAPPAFHQVLANTETPRSTLISAFVSQASGPQVVGASLVDSTNRRVGFGGVSDERKGDLPAGCALRLSGDSGNPASPTTGQMLFVSSPGNTQWTLELNGWQSGTVNISLVLPLNSSTYRQVVFSGVQITQGGRSRVVFRPLSSSSLTLQEFSGGAFRDVAANIIETTLDPLQPALVGAMQIAPEVLDGGDKYGRVVGLLFSKPMAKNSMETIARYQIGGGTLAGQSSGEQVGGTIHVTAAKANFGERFVFLSLDSPVGPYITRTVTADVLNDPRGLRVNQQQKNIVPTVSPQGTPPGAYLTGRVLNADGSPVSNTPVTYYLLGCGPLAPPIPIAAQRTDANGQYVFDYVRDGDCSPLYVATTHPVTGSTKRLSASVLYDGQHMVLDPVFLARGSIQGTVRLDSNPAPRAFVRVIPELDIVGSQLAQADFLGQYQAQNLPVGNVSVLAVGYGNQSNATGLAVGTVRGDGVVSTINVALNNISGAVSGRVVFQDGATTPSVGSLVVAFANFPELDGPLVGRSVGYSFTDREGNFSIQNLPLGNIRLVARDARLNQAEQQVLLTQTTREVNWILLSYPSFTQTYGSISGTVQRDDGTPIVNAGVRVENQEVRTGAGGAYSFSHVRVGAQTVLADDPQTNLSGTATATVIANQTTTNINVIITRPVTINGHVYLQRDNAPPQPVANAVVHAGGASALTDAQGAYTLNNAPGGSPFTLAFVHPNGKLAVNQSLVLAPGQTIERNATFQPATLHGTIYQADGATGTIAQLKISTLLPNTNRSFGCLGCLIQQEISTQSLADGSYKLEANPGAFRVTASNFQYPIPVSKGGTLSNGEDRLCDVRLANAPGRIQGRVFQPDGTPVGSGVLVALESDTYPEISVLTDDAGHYLFEDSVPEGGYTLTATDGNTGRTRRISISVRQNSDATFNLTLLGSGDLRVHVLNASGNPVSGGFINVEGVEYPVAKRNTALDATDGGTFEFNGLPEGHYSISATSQGLAGLKPATIVKGALTEITVTLQGAGTITGRVLLPGGTDGAALASVSLIGNNQVVSVATASDAEGHQGEFSFTNVPTGSYTLEALDNRSGRMGRATASVAQQGTVAVADIQLVAVGAVTGLVTSNGAPVQHALVLIESFSSVASSPIQATTDEQGRYRFTGIPVGPFTVSVINAPGGLTGQFNGQITGTTEPLPDTIANIALEASVTFTGTVRKADGSGPLPGARVTIVSGFSLIRETATDVNGQYRLEFVPIREGMKVRAVSPLNSSDRGEVSITTAPAPGSTVNINIQLAGTGAVGGAATDHLGNPLSSGTVTLINDEWGAGERISIATPVQANGEYRIPVAPVGTFTLLLSTPNDTRGGYATGTIIAGQTLNLPIRLADAGTVTGRVQNEQGVPLTNAVVTLKTFSGINNRVTLADVDGRFVFNNVPLGTYYVEVFDPSADGTLTLPIRNLTTNGETLDYGNITVDTQSPAVESITPENGATGVSLDTQIRVRFSEPVSSSVYAADAIRIIGGAEPIIGYRALVLGGRELVIQRLYNQPWLTDLTTYTVIVTTQVKDLANHPLVSEARSSFTTADGTGPIVTEAIPANNAVQVPVTTTVRVSFNEALAPDQDAGDVLNLYRPGFAQVVATAVMSTDRKTITLTPNQPLAENTRYSYLVSGQRDAVGNTGPGVFNSFATIDQVAPTIGQWRVDQLDLDNRHFARRYPSLTLNYDDSGSGVDLNATKATLDGVNLSGQDISIYETGISYRPTTPLLPGTHTINARVVDKVGNASERAATFVIDDAVVVTSITPSSSSSLGGIQIRLNGQGLETTYQGQPQVFIGGNEAQLAFVNGDYDACNLGRCISVIVPPGTPGPATVVVQTDHGTATVPGGFTYLAETRTPFVVEPDTVVLWHLDDFYIGEDFVGSPDAGPNHLLAECPSPLVPGRFRNGISPGSLSANEPYGANLLSFTDSAFTLEGWFKTDPASVSPDQSYTLFGREYYDQSQEPDYALKFLPSGDLRARLYNQNGDVWETTMAASVYPFNDGQWHYVAMVVERGNAPAQNRLVIYVDGLERAATPAPQNFGSLRNTAYYRFGSTDFPGVRDEIRASSTAHTAAQIQQYYENNTVTIGDAVPLSLVREAATEMAVTGYRLKNVTASITATDGSPLPASVQIISSTDNLLHLSITVDVSAPLGGALLTLTDNGQTATRPVTIVAPVPFSAQDGTILLWHMDEQSGNAVSDAGPLGINGYSPYSFGFGEGRFGLSRVGPITVVNPDPPELSFGASSFTIEGWFKNNYGYTYEQTLVRKGYVDNSDPGAFELRLLSNGKILARLRDTAGLVWEARTQTRPNQTQDTSWHLFSMVVQRGAQPEQNRLLIYLDGTEQASTQAPPAFGGLQPTTFRFQVGDSYFISYDEVRVLNFARTAEAIRNTWIGIPTMGRNRYRTGEPKGLFKLSNSFLDSLAQPVLTSNRLWLWPGRKKDFLNFRNESVTANNR